jgi:hypothetical protein
MTRMTIPVNHRKGQPPRQEEVIEISDELRRDGYDISSKAIDAALKLGPDEAATAQGFHADRHKKMFSSNTRHRERREARSGKVQHGKL